VKDGGDQEPLALVDRLHEDHPSRRIDLPA
jgi:hypothetical protein